MTHPPQPPQMPPLPPRGNGTPGVPAQQPPVQPPVQPPAQRQRRQRPQPPLAGRPQAPIQPQHPVRQQAPQQPQQPQLPQQPRQQQAYAQPQAPQPGQQARAQVPRAQTPRPQRAPRTTTPTSARLAAALARSRAWARPAATGARVAAFIIDLFVVLVIAALTWVFTKSAVLGVLALLEAAIILAVLEARTGITLGNLLLRMRTVRDDSPFSPGVARGAVRALVQGAGTLVGFVGGIVVTATSAADPMRMGRSIADRAGRTLVVKVPSAAERQAWAQGAEAWAASAQSITAAQQQPPLVAAVQQPQAVPARVQAAAPSAQPAQQVAPVQPVAHIPQASPIQQPAPTAPGTPADPAILRTPAPERGPVTGTTPPEQNERMPAGVVPVDAPIAAPPPPVRRVETGEQLLLTFDTGQRAQLAIPVTVNLGRKPDRTEQDDQLVVVQDSEGTVSKTHLRLDYRGDSVWLTDLGSTNGSEILDDTGEGTLLAHGVRVRLEDGSRVRLGNRSFTVATVRGQG